MAESHLVNGLPLGAGDSMLIVQPEMNYDYSKRDYLLPDGCKDISDALKLEALKANENREPLRTNEEIRQVFRKFFPAIAAGTVEIVSLARIVGRGCLLVVRSHDPKVSAMEACRFERGERLNALIAELHGEYFCIMLWQPSPEEFIRIAFLGPQKAVLDSGTHQAVVTLNPIWFHHFGIDERKRRIDQLSEMTILVSELTGWKISLAEEETD